MKKISLLLISILSLSIILSGCNCIDGITKSMDRNTIKYNGKTYKSISRCWEMKSPDDYTSKTISYDGVNLKARFYNNDKNNEFIYIEDDEQLYHNVKFSLPTNKDIEYLSIGYINEEKSLDINEGEILKEFKKLTSQKTYSNVEIKDNIASIDINYKNYPVCYYYGNIIIDKQGDKWISLENSEADNNSFIKLDDNSKLLSKVNKG